MDIDIQVSSWTMNFDWFSTRTVEASSTWRCGWGSRENIRGTEISILERALPSGSFQVEYSNWIFKMNVESEAKELDSIQIFQNHFKIQLDVFNSLTVELAPVKENLADSSRSSNQLEISTKIPVSFEVVEVMLHQLLRQSHLNSFRQYENNQKNSTWVFNLKAETSFSFWLNSKIQLEAHVIRNRRLEILEKLRDFYGHQWMSEEVQRAMHGVAQHFPRAQLHRHSTHSPLTSSFQVSYGNRYNITYYNIL